MMMIPLMQEVSTSVLLLRSYQGAVGPNVEIGGPYSACDPIRSMLKVEVYLDYQYGLRLTEHELVVIFIHLPAVPGSRVVPTRQLNGPGSDKTPDGYGHTIRGLRTISVAQG
jgi:hypothetical protein